MNHGASPSGAAAPPAGLLHYALLALPAGLFALLAWGLAEQPLPWRLALDWVPSLGLAAEFRVDGLSAQMLALITGIGALVFVYAHGYLEHEPRRDRLLAVLALFMLAMVGAVTADNVILLFLFWELTSLTSFFLVGWNHRDSRARASARQALLLTLAGGLALLGGLILLAGLAHTWTLSGILAAAPSFREDPRLAWALGLVFLGAFSKSAQFPFHFWLPNAMSAPTPVSAYLHSATMVKLGIYLLARLDPAFNDLPLWEYTLVGVGTLTAVWAAILALRERDLKRILARTTVSALGIMVLLVGMPSEGAGLALVAFMFAHALYKAPLFMVAGNIDHATGTRNIDHLMGLRRIMPWSAAIAILAGFSMAGLPMSFGFIAKDVIASAKAEADVLALVSHAMLLVNAITVAVAGVAAVRVFWGPAEWPEGKVHEVPWSMRLPPLVIALTALEFEFLPNLADPLLLAAGQSVSPSLSVSDLAASYRFQGTLTALEITLILGIALFMAWDRLHRALHTIHWLDRLGPAAAYEHALHGLARLAALHTRVLQHGRLPGYQAWLVGALLALGLFAAWRGGFSVDLGGLGMPDEPLALAWLAACLVILAGAVAAVSLRDRLALLMASGLVGYGSAALFLFAGAPDLALTQFAVETVLVVVAAALLPRFRAQPAKLAEPVWRNGLLALLAGVGTFMLMAPLAGQPLDTDLSRWFGAASLPQAHGHNVVNVIIVDFRALDTLGEISVVFAALLAALPILTAWRRAPRGSMP
jgi:multicomponent Na+:H+ antiporter subunit A